MNRLPRYTVSATNDRSCPITVRCRCWFCPSGCCSRSPHPCSCRRCCRLVCIAAVQPGGLAHTHYLCKRLRAEFADLKILSDCRVSEASWSQSVKLCCQPGQIKLARVYLSHVTS